MNVKDLGEDALIQSLTTLLYRDASVLVGPGDDCAVTVHPDLEFDYLHKIDTVVEGVHFEAGEQGERVGWKAVARVLSDFAAMGGVGKHLVISLACNDQTPVTWLRAVYRGANRCAEEYQCSIVGGETTSTKGPIVISVAGNGEVKKPALTLRSTASVSDVLCVTGLLGGSIKGKHLDFEPRVKQGNWLGSREEVTAMMDISDGLAKDLVRMGQASGCEFSLMHDSIPKNKDCSIKEAMCDGEDYELLFTVKVGCLDNLITDFKSRFPSLQVHSIGKCVEVGKGDQFKNGWEHFKN